MSAQITFKIENSEFIPKMSLEFKGHSYSL